MNETPATPPTVHQTTYAMPQTWKIGFVVAIIMVALAILGVGLTMSGWTIGPKYWMTLVPAFGLLCIFTAWSRSRLGEGGPQIVLKQVAHWLCITAAVWLEFFIRNTGEETTTTAGFNALLLLAVGCFLAGIYLEWLFCIVGLLLTLTLIVVVRADQYLWLIVVVGLLAVAAMFGIMRMFVKKEERKIVSGSAVPSSS